MASLLITIFLVYVGLGAVFAALFVTIGVQNVDTTAQSASVGFRLVIFLGAAALWPLMLMKWLGVQAEKRNQNTTRSTVRSQQNQHILAWLVLTPVLIALFFIGLSARPGPTAYEAEARGTSAFGADGVEGPKAESAYQKEVQLEEARP